MTQMVGLTERTERENREEGMRQGCGQKEERKEVLLGLWSALP